MCVYIYAHIYIMFSTLILLPSGSYWLNPKSSTSYDIQETGMTIKSTLTIKHLFLIKVIFLQVHIKCVSCKMHS